MAEWSVILSARLTGVHRSWHESPPFSLHQAGLLAEMSSIHMVMTGKGNNCGYLDNAVVPGYCVTITCLRLKV